jgi:hypothetical protein
LRILVGEFGSRGKGVEWELGLVVVKLVEEVQCASEACQRGSVYFRSLLKRFSVLLKLAKDVQCASEAC